MDDRREASARDLQDVPIYPVRAVQAKTGLKPDTLRAWERRYGIPSPERTPGGHRLYSERDIATLQWLIAQLDEGMRISAAVALWRKIADQGEDPLSASPAAEPDGLTVPTALAHIRAAWLDACVSFDEAGAERAINQAFALHDVETVLSDVLRQGLHEIGEMWYRDEISVQHEHFATGMVARRLHALIQATPPPLRHQSVLIGSPSGDPHGVPALLLTLLMRRRGFEALHLGADVPAERLRGILEELRPAAVILSAQMLNHAAALQDIAKSVLESGVVVGYGGRIFRLVPKIRDRIPAYYLGDTLEASPAKIEILVREGFPPPGIPPVRKRMAEAYQSLMREGDAVAFHVSHRMAAMGVPEAALGQALTFTNRGLQAALSLGDLTFMEEDLSWVRGLLQHRGVNAAQLSAFWGHYRDVSLQLMGEEAQPLTDWMEQVSLEPEGKPQKKEVSNL